MTLSLLIKGITVPEHRLRELNMEEVDKLAESIDKVDLQHPIIVRSDGGMGHRLISGLHRLRAFEKLGRDTIPAECRDVSDDEARLIEITENLHRAELNYIEKSDHVKAWDEYLKANPRRSSGNGSEEVSSQVATKPPGNISPDADVGGRPTGGMRQLARDLNLDKDEVHRSLKIASLDQRVKDAALVSGIARRQKDLLAVVKAKEAGASVEEQVGIVEKWGEKRKRDNSRPTKSNKAKRKDPVQEPEAKAEPETETAKDYTLEDAHSELRAIFRKLSPADRQRFNTDLEDIGERIFQELAVA